MKTNEATIRICPRCGKDYAEHPALSRTDNETLICPDCGTREAGVQLFIALIQNLPTIIVEIVKAVPQIIAGLVSAFGQGVGKLAEVGGNLVKGLWSGIQSLASWLWDKVSGWVSSIWDGICNFFGIHSPSTEMGWIGKMMVEGLAGSISDNGKDAVKAVSDMGKGIDGVMKGVADDMQTSLPTDFDMNVNGAVNGMNGASATAQAFNVTIPLTLDGATLTRIISQIQWSQNAVTVRNLGTV